MKKENSTTSKKRRMTVALMAAAILVLVAAPMTAQEIDETFRARIIDTNGALPDRSSTNLRFGLKSVTPDEEVMELAQVLAQEGPAALRSRLEKSDRGWVQFGTSASYPLSFVRIFEREGGRSLRLMTHRPIGINEALYNMRTTDYPFTVFEIQLDENDRGEGGMMVGARMEFQGNQFVVTSYGMDPFRVIQVAPTGKKKKKKN